MKQYENKLLTQQEFKDNDFKNAERMALKLGYTQTAYTSTSDLIGLFCLRDNPETTVKRGGMNTEISGCIIKTEEFGFMFVATDEDVGFNYGELK